jgi:hypothetical protein
MGLHFAREGRSVNITSGFRNPREGVAEEPLRASPPSKKGGVSPSRLSPGEYGCDRQHGQKELVRVICAAELGSRAVRISTGVSFYDQRHLFASRASHGDAAESRILIRGGSFNR